MSLTVNVANWVNASGMNWAIAILYSICFWVDLSSRMAVTAGEHITLPDDGVIYVGVEHGPQKICSYFCCVPLSIPSLVDLQSNQLPASDKMATGKVATFLCPICLNLDYSQLPKADPPHTLDEYQISTSYLELEASAKGDDCLACKIIYTGIESVLESYEESLASPASTRLFINLRRVAVCE